MAQKLVGPTKRPQEFGMTNKDYHLIVNDAVETCKGFRGDGTKLFEVPALARGQGLTNVWWKKYSDTPPGLYRVGKVYYDYDNPSQTSQRDKLAYGWYSLDLIELEDQERNNGRAGIMIHGGGSALGWPGAWAAYQRLLPTLGCVRMHNAHLRDRLIPLVKTGANVFVSVYQEA
jgi:hypothetical protein